MNPGVKYIASSISILELLRCSLCGLAKDTLLTCIVCIFFTRKCICEKKAEMGIQCLQWKYKLSSMG